MQIFTNCKRRFYSCREFYVIHLKNQRLKFDHSTTLRTKYLVYTLLLEGILFIFGPGSKIFARTTNGICLSTIVAHKFVFSEKKIQELPVLSSKQGFQHKVQKDEHRWSFSLLFSNWLFI